QNRIRLLLQFLSYPGNLSVFQQYIADLVQFCIRINDPAAPDQNLHINFILHPAATRFFPSIQENRSDVKPGRATAVPVPSCKLTLHEFSLTFPLPLSIMESQFRGIWNY